jgi:hypothetical protein
MRQQYALPSAIFVGTISVNAIYIGSSIAPALDALAFCPAFCHFCMLWSLVLAVHPFWARQRLILLSTVLAAMCLTAQCTPHCPQQGAIHFNFVHTTHGGFHIKYTINCLGLQCPVCFGVSPSLHFSGGPLH